MEQRRPIWLSVFSVIMVAAVAILAIYSAGYFLLSDSVSSPEGERSRCFRHPWLAKLYVPAAKWEAFFTGVPTEAYDCSTDLE